MSLVAVLRASNPSQLNTVTQIRYSSLAVSALGGPTMTEVSGPTSAVWKIK
jgi:hypothetical protein